MTAPEPTPAHISPSSYATPYRLSERRLAGLPPAAEVYISFPHGKGRRLVRVDLDRRELLTMIANAADALRLLDEAST